MNTKNYFQNNHYDVIRNALTPEMANLCYKYLINKRRVMRLIHEKRLVSPWNDHWGTQQDEQAPGAWANYSDVLMETLLSTIKSQLEDRTQLKLIETYSYCRLYVYGNILHRHKDRPSCALSATMNLGGDIWPIFVDPLGKGHGIEENGVVKYIPGNEKGIQVDLEPGDLMIYKGCELEHWRETFMGESCGQVFLHYNDLASPNAMENKFDGRPCLGLPVSAKRHFTPN